MAPWIIFAMNGNFGAYKLSELCSNMNPVLLVQMQNVRCFELGVSKSQIVAFFFKDDFLYNVAEAQVTLCFSTFSFPPYHACSFYQVVEEIKYLRIIFNNRHTWDGHVRFVHVHHELTEC